MYPPQGWPGAVPAPPAPDQPPSAYPYPGQPWPQPPAAPYPQQSVPPYPVQPWQQPSAGPYAPPPAWPVAQAQPQPKPPRPPRPRHWWQPWARVIAAAVVALGVGLGAAYGAGPSSVAPVPDAAPFYLAVFGLSVEPMMQYTGRDAGQDASWQLTVTNGGEELGTLTSEGSQTPVMVVGGLTYFKPPAALLANLPGGESAAQLANTWITGDDSLEALLPAAPPPSPAQLASAIDRALAGSPQFPAVGAPAVKWNGIPALAVDLSIGRLYVTSSAPYRVLALTPLPAGSAAASAPAGALAAAPAVLDAATGLTQAATPDFTPMAQTGVDQDYATLISQTQTLGSAVNIGITFSFNQQGNLSCSDSSCTVTETVDTDISSVQDIPVSGQVDASMTAAVTVDGQPGGQCADTATLPIAGSGTMTCVDAGTAAQTAQIEQQAQDEADQEAAENPGQEITVPYTIHYAADVQIEALADASAQVTQDVGGEQQEQQATDQQAQTDDGCPLADTSAAAGPGGTQGADSILTAATPRDCRALFDGTGLQHALDSHTPGGSTVRPTATLFKDYYDPEQIRELIQETVEYGDESPSAPDPKTGLPRDTTLYTMTFENQPIGETQGADPKTINELQVAVAPNGRLVTAYPYYSGYVDGND